jgi:hypothetical protein
MSAFTVLFLLGVVTVFILVRWLLGRHPKTAHHISRSVAIFLWAFGFIVAASVLVVLIQGVIIAHFPTIAQLIAASDSDFPTWILFGIVAASGISGLVMGLRGRLPGTS